MEAKQEFNDLYQNSNSVFCFLRRMKKEGKDLEEGRCLRGRDRGVNFIEEWDHTVETNVVEGPVKKVVRIEIVEAMQKMKSGKATGPSEINAEMIVASGETGIKVCVSVY